MREKRDRIRTPTSGLFLKQAGWQNGKNARNVHSGSLSNPILQNTHSVTAVPVRMAQATAGCNCILWFPPKSSSFPSLPWVPDSAERHHSSSSTEGNRPQSRTQVCQTRTMLCLAHCKCKSPQPKMIQSARVAKHCSLHRSRCDTKSRKHVHSAGPGNHMPIMINFAGQCGRVQIKGTFLLEKQRPFIKR